MEIIRNKTHTHILVYSCFLPVVAYNKYVEVVGHSIGAGACANVRRQGRIYHIEDDTCLLQFLSEEEEGTDNDWLYVVIADIVSPTIHMNNCILRPNLLLLSCTSIADGAS